jgi:hypothetical protein
MRISRLQTCYNLRITVAVGGSLSAADLVRWPHRLETGGCPNSNPLKMSTCFLEFQRLLTMQLLPEVTVFGSQSPS